MQRDLDEEENLRILPSLISPIVPSQYDYLF